MMKQVFIVFALAAGCAVAADHYHFTLAEPSVVKGSQLKAGDYQLNLHADSVTISNGKQKVDVPAKVENSDKKFSQTRVLYFEDKGTYKLQEIEIGGTNTKVLFDSGVQSGGGD